MGSVIIKNLNDFIEPGTVCIKTTNQSAKATPAPSEYKVFVEGERVSAASAPQNDANLVKIALHDCLACSGCITTSETLLVTAQSIDAFVADVQSFNIKAAPSPSDAPRTFLTLAEQSVCSLAAQFGAASYASMARVAVSFAKRHLGFDRVLCSDAARAITLYELYREFKTHYAASRVLLSGECPGWICYAEKTQPEEMLHAISRVKSPQQITGTLVKRLFGWGPATYHATVMPCFDKKLEAARPDFATGEERDVDCVLSTAEFSELFARYGFDVAAHLAADASSQSEADADACPFDQLPADGRGCWLPGSALFGGGAGGYVENLLILAANDIFAAKQRTVLSADTFSTQIVRRATRSPDFVEYALVDAATGTDLLVMATAYGFRNVQSVVRRLKSGSLAAYAFVEVMACPAGCLNGGGQIKAAASGDAAIGETWRSTLQRVEAVFARVPRAETRALCANVEAFYAQMAVDEARASMLFHTQLHSRKEQQSASSLVW